MDDASVDHANAHFGLNAHVGNEDISSVVIGNQETAYQEDVFSIELTTSAEVSLEMPIGPVELVYQNAELQRKLRGSEQNLRRLETQLIDHRNESVRKDQQHVIDIRSKQEEITTLIRRNEDLENQNEILNQENTRLVSQLVEQNIQSQERSSRASTHEAVLNRLSRTEVENRSVIEQRDELKRELEAFKEQHANISRQNDLWEHRVQDLNNQIVVLNETFEDKFKAQHENTDFWKHKYECEMQTRTCPKREEPTFVNQTIEVPDQVVSRTGSFTDVNPPCVENNANGMNSSGLMNVSANTGTPVLGRKKVFYVDQSHLPYCKNCGTVLDENRYEDGVCRFHLSPPQPYKPWNSFKGHGDVKPHRKQRFYWPCCEKIGICQPPGCRALRHHEVIFPTAGEE